MTRDVRGRFLDLTLVGASIAALLVAALVEVDATALRLFGVELPAVCTWRRLFGIACPTCGLSRGFVAVAHGQWAQGFTFHPLAPVAYILIVGAALYALLRLWRDQRRPLSPSTAKVHP